MAILGLTAVAVALPSAGASGGAPAHKAGGTNKACPEKALCVWKKAGYQGRRVKVTKVGTSNKIANQLNDQASSVKNRYKNTAYLYADKSGEGDLRCVSSDGNVNDLAGSYDFDEVASSSRLLKNPQACL